MIDEEGAFPKLEHPQKNANWFSIITFFYTIQIFRKGSKRDFDEDDLTKPLDEHKSSILGHKLAVLWSKEVDRANEAKDVPSLYKLILKMFFKDIFRQGMCLFIMEIPIRLCQPIFLGLLLRYFCSENEHYREETEDGPTYIMRMFSFWKVETRIGLTEAYFFASGVVLCSLINVIVLHPCFMSVMHVGMKIRIACCSLIYRKTLRLDLTCLSGSTVGNVVNLMSNDVNRFDLAVMHFHYIWIAPLQMFFCLLLMYQLVGLAAVYGICAILVFIPLQAWFGNRTSRFRMKTAARTDERVRQMNEIIQGMQVIKMYTWEYAFANQIDQLRRLEMNVLKATSYIRGAILSFIMFTSRLGVFLTVVAIVIRHDEITAEKVFAVTSFYQILRQTMTLFFPNAIAQIAETNVAVTRITRFLLASECSIGDKRILHPKWVANPQSQQNLLENNNDPSVSVINASVKIEDQVCLQNVNLQIKKGDLVAFIGQVGSGKTSLLNLILGEFQPCLGSAKIKGVMSYACQEPWLFAGSVRQNILFGRQFQKHRYYSVVRACALVRDFQLLPYGDETIVGEKGASLSGGQRARINLARAVYKKADIYLLDDPLSAVDANVGKQLFDHCISGFLSDKIVILVTHQLQFLSSVNKVVLMHDGQIEAEGSYQFLQSTDLDFAEFLRNQLTVDSDDTEQQSEQDKVNTIMKDLHYVSHVSLSVIDMEGARYKPKEVAEIRTKGSVECYVFKEYFKAGGNCCVILSVFSLFIGAQVLVSGGDFFVSQWVDVEEKDSANENTSNLLLNNLSTNTCITIYSIIMFLTVVIALTRSLVFFTVCMRASINLHNQMFQSVITASMLFFNTNTSGRILNRFSKDLGSVDELLPNAMIDCTQIMLNLVGAVAIVCYVNYYLIIPTVLMCICFYVLRRFYIKTSRSVKRLEGISRSPVFAHLGASIQGLATIRSNGQELLLVSEFDNLQDDHSSAWFMFISTSRAFGYWLDIICTIFIGIVAYSFLIVPSTGGEVGLAITTTIGLTGLFQWGMKQSAELENQMTSVERVLEYTRIEHEPDLESRPGEKPISEWPTRGEIVFDDLIMKYNPDNPPVLKHLNFLISPKEKIGIVGRTGAGKSSLIAALFRLAPFEGAILIDEVDTTSMGLHDLRKKISIIPQEPVLFSGTLRYNMDPFHNYDDDDIVKALTVVEIKSATMEGNNCLKSYVHEGGVNISVGERQMICLARAILRNNRILVLDEATANVDPQTDKFIQTTIRSKFAECTVLTIAHRLHTIMDSDRVLVMDAGSVVEFDHPHILLNNRSGTFSQMVAKTGSAMAQNLKNIAKMSYEMKRKQPT